MSRRRLEVRSNRRDARPKKSLGLDVSRSARSELAGEAAPAKIRLWGATHSRRVFLRFAQRVKQGGTIPIRCEVIRGWHSLQERTRAGSSLRLSSRFFPRGEFGKSWTSIHPRHIPRAWRPSPSLHQIRISRVGLIPKAATALLRRLVLLDEVYRFGPGQLGSRPSLR